MSRGYEYAAHGLLQADDDNAEAQVSATSPARFSMTAAFTRRSRRLPTPISAYLPESECAV